MKRRSLSLGKLVLGSLAGKKARPGFSVRLKKIRRPPSSGGKNTAQAWITQALAIPPQQGVAVIHREIAPTQPPEVKHPVLEMPRPQSVKPEAPSLQTEDLLRPDSELRRSIEAFLLDQRSQHTRRAYGMDLKRFISFLRTRKLGNGGFETLDRAVVIAYKEYLLAEKLEHTTVDRHLATLRSFFGWLRDDGIITRSPAESVRFLSPRRVSSTIGFSDEEVRRVLMQPDLHRRTGALHYAVLMMLFFCGLRRSELCSLEVASLGEERGHRVIRLRGKGNAERVVVLRPEVWNAIRYYFMITARNFNEKQVPLFMPVRNPHAPAGIRKAIDPSMVFYIVTRYARKAGIANRVSPHSCRATAISNARDRNVPDRAIQEFAGWASPEMITRYDKRRTSVEGSAAHAIEYGQEVRVDPTTGDFRVTPDEGS